MNRRRELAEIVDKWNLLKHPFYQAWSAGKLPVEALQVYAREYGTFIQTLPQGWLTLQDTGTAHEEREHAELWADFAHSLSAAPGAPEIDETAALMQTAKTLFAQPVTALGALYAFEVQQPATATSKLDGLNKWYHLEDGGKKYFEVHTANGHESGKILAQINRLPLHEQGQALKACEEMAQALWKGLTGIHSKVCTD
jgi:pyrroloquinoline-quinone synthase